MEKLAQPIRAVKVAPVTQLKGQLAAAEQVELMAAPLGGGKPLVLTDLAAAVVAAVGLAAAAARRLAELQRAAAVVAVPC